METSERDNSLVHVYAANEDTIVHICQLIYESDDDHAVSLTYVSFTSIGYSIHAGFVNAFDHSMRKRI